jgi:hypothetical protein
LLQLTIADYAMSLASADLEMFAYEMELIPGAEASLDPALRSEFMKRYAHTLPTECALVIAAEYVKSELVVLRRVTLAERIVSEMQMAHSVLISVAAPLRRWFGDAM